VRLGAIRLDSDQCQEVGASLLQAALAAQFLRALKRRHELRKVRGCWHRQGRGSTDRDAQARRMKIDSTRSETSQAALKQISGLIPGLVPFSLWISD